MIRASRGQTLGLSILYGAFFFIFFIMIINFLQPDIRAAQQSLDCSNTNISDGSKIACLLVDGLMPYFIILVVSAALGAVTSRMVGGLQ